MKFPAILVLMLLVVIVCPTWAAIGDAHADGTLRVLAYDLEPFFYVDAAGDPGGLEYEILHAFATRHGLELRIIWVAEFQELIPKLRGGEGDMISAGMTITEKRREIVDFSASYFPNRVVTVVSTAEGGRLSLAGKRVATISGTTYEEILREIPGVRLVYGETERDLFRLVASGEAFALACDAGFALWILPDFEGLGIAGFLSERQEYGFVVPKESSLKPLLDQHLAELNADGSYRTWIRGIFGELGEVFLSEAVNQ